MRLPQQVSGQTQIVWSRWMAHTAKGLDFSDPEDRAVFRGFVAAAMVNLKVTGARALAAYFGKPVPGNSSHSTAVRACADAWIQRHSGKR